MTNLLLMSEKMADALLHYGVCTIIILIALIIMGIMKNKTKKELRASTVKKSCVKAKVVAEKALAEKNNLKVLAGTRLLKVNKYVASAFWYAFQIADTKKDIVFEGIASSLDALSSKLVKEANNGYISEEEYESYVRNAITVLDTAIAKIDALAQ